MSYSFSIRAASKTEAFTKVADELIKFVESQPVHAQDQGQALGTAETLIALLTTDLTKDVAVSMNGSISEYPIGVISAVSVSVSASLVAKEIAK